MISTVLCQHDSPAIILIALKMSHGNLDFQSAVDLAFLHQVSASDGAPFSLVVDPGVDILSKIEFDHTQ